MPTAPELRDPRFDLSLEILHRGAIRITAWGTSMLPSIWPGDLLTVEPARHDEVVGGDIVLVLRNHRVFIHRVVGTREENGRQMWITQGDSMPQSDPAAFACDLPGKVVGIRRGGRSFAPERRMSTIDSMLAWLFCHSDRLRNLALRVHAAQLHVGSLQTDSSRRIDLAEDASGMACLPYISQSSGSHV